MRIVGLTLARIPLSLVSPLRTSTGTHAARTAALVGVTLEDGSTGWGEDVAPEGDFYTGETAETSCAALRDVLLRGLAEREFDSPFDIDAAWWGTSAFPMARCAVESALWDAWSRSKGMSLATALGGIPRDVSVGAVVGLHDHLDAVVADAHARVSEGYRHLKVKIAPGRDVAVLDALRPIVEDGVTVSVDANGAYGAADVDLLASLARRGVGVVEQPFAPTDLKSAASLRATGAVKVGLDESVCTLDDLDVAVAAGAIDALNVKPSRMGGLGVAVRALERCRAAGLDAWVGGMLESGVGRASALALATHPACTLPPDLSASSRYFVHDVTEPFELVAGDLAVPRAPGLGRVPNRGVLESATIETLL